MSIIEPTCHSGTRQKAGYIAPRLLYTFKEACLWICRRKEKSESDIESISVECGDGSWKRRVEGMEHECHTEGVEQLE